MQDQKKGQPAGSTGSKTGGSGGTTGKTGEKMSEETGTQGQTGMQQRGSMGQTERGGTYGEQMRGWETGAQQTTARVTHGRGEQESEDAGMQQVSLVIREAREEGDPEMQMREEDLHARQQNLGERERSLRERDEQLRMREQGLRERQVRVTGRGMGATDYTDDIHIQNRR